MSDLAWLILPVLIGPFVGSFLGLVSVRLPRGLPVVFGRSACPGCERTLGPLDLVPIASFILFRGRCRTCAAPIPRRYLALELACPALALWAGLAHPGAEGALGALYAWQLLLLALLDAEHFWLPRLLTLPLIVTGLAAASELLQRLAREPLQIQFTVEGKPLQRFAISRCCCCEISAFQGPSLGTKIGCRCCTVLC